MKTTILFFILLGISFLGCSDNFDNTLVSTTITSDNIISSTPIPSDQNDSPIHDTEVIRMNFNHKVICPLIVASKSINGETGGELIVERTYVNYQGRELYVYASIEVPPFAFQGTTDIKMILHPEEASVEFFPHMVFDREVKVWVWFEGIDLKEIGYNTTGHADFAFFDDDGSTEIIQAQLTHVNMNTETIKVQNAQLNHFSRYGWVR